MSFLQLALQVGLGFVVTVLIYIITLWFMQNDRLVFDARRTVNTPIRVKVIDGYVEAQAFNKKRFNTVYVNNSTYLPIRRSVNRYGGAQFTYQFWLYVERPHALPANFPLFLKGDNTEYAYTKSEVAGIVTTQFGDAVTSSTSSGTQRMRPVVCPMVMLGSGINDLVVRFNSTQRLDHDVVIASQENPDDTQRHNITSLQPGRWMLYTISFVDNIPLSDFENGVLVRTYINDVLYQVNKLPNVALRQNDGDLHVLPEPPAGNVGAFRISNLIYYNYAVTDTDVIRTFRSGPNLREHQASKVDSNVLDASAYNKLDIYNL